MKDKDSEFFEKQKLRNVYLGYRNNLSLHEREKKSGEILKLLKEEKIYQDAQIILVYMDFHSEVITTKLVEELLLTHEKRVFAPKVEGADMQFYEVMDMKDLVEGYQGIREPKGDPDQLFNLHFAKQQKCLLLVPGSVFDRERGRMGYGKGFYDRYLASFPFLPSAALAFGCQIADKVPITAQDRKPDIIITDREVIR